MIKAEVAFMNGGRVIGYYYIRLAGTDLIACRGGHPEFPLRFNEDIKDAKKKAMKACREVNRQLRIMCREI